MKEHTRLARASRIVQRRTFLKAVGLGLTVPAAVQLSRMAVAQSTGPLKRMLVLFLPHGIAPEHYNPRVVGGDPTNFVLDDTNVSTLGPLEPYKNYVNVYQGFQYMGDASTHEGVVNFLSGVTTIDDTTPRTTLEHVIGKEIGIDPLILGACAHMPYGLQSQGKVFWNGSAIDPEKDPSVVADELFGAAGAAQTTPAADPSQPDPNLALRQELLKLTSAEITELQSSLNGLTQEQTKLQTHLQAIESLQASSDDKGMAAGQVVSCASRPNMPSVEQVRSESAGQVIDPSGGNDYFYQESNFPLLFDAQLELTTQALICGIKPIIGLQPMYTTCEFDFGFAGTPGSHHNGLSHLTPQQAAGAQYDSPVSVDNYAPEPRAPFAKAQLWFTTKLVDKVVSILATTDDPTAPGTSVLDNTLIYWASEIGDGANHLRVSGLEYPNVPAHLPLVTIGGAGGGLKTGQVISMPIVDASEKDGRPATDIYLTLAQAMGATNATFPLTTGPVTEALT